MESKLPDKEVLVNRLQELSKYSEKDLQYFCIDFLRKRKLPLKKYNVIKEYSKEVSPIYFASFIVHDMSHQLTNYENTDNVLIQLTFSGLTVWKIIGNAYSILESIDYPQMILLLNSYVEKFTNR